MSRKELQVSWFGYKNDAALAGLSGLKTNEAKFAGALNVQSLGPMRIILPIWNRVQEGATGILVWI